MRIVCPSCAAAYEVAAALLGPGRTARCARCGHEWVPMAAEPESAPHELASQGLAPREPLPPIPEPPSLDERQQAARPPSRNGRAARAPFAAGAWLLSVCVIVALGWSAVHFRAEVMQVWPASQRVYVLLGLD